MGKIKLPQLPFLTREMLTFGRTAKIEIQLDYYANSNYTISVIGATRAGTFKHSHTHTGDNGLEQATFGIPEIPIFLTLSPLGPGIPRGSMWGAAYLLINGEKVLKLCSGYISALNSPSYPASESGDELLGGGLLRPITGGNPAAGADADDNTPSNVRWLLKSYKITLVTDGNAANRRVHFTIQKPTFFTSYFEAFPSVDQTASTTKTYYFAPYPFVADEEDDDMIVCSIPPDLILEAGLNPGTRTTNIQAGDNFGQPTITVEQYHND